MHQSYECVLESYVHSVIISQFFRIDCNDIFEEKNHAGNFSETRMSNNTLTIFCVLISCFDFTQDV